MRKFTMKVNGEMIARAVVNKKVCMDRMSVEDLFKLLMNTQVKDVVKALASFIYQAYQIRRTCLRFSK